MTADENALRRDCREFERSVALAKHDQKEVSAVLQRGSCLVGQVRQGCGVVLQGKGGREGAWCCGVAVRVFT